MAHSTPGMHQAIYGMARDAFAEDFALAMNPGHPLLGGFDRERYEADRQRFVDTCTPSRLAQITRALTPE